MSSETKYYCKDCGKELSVNERPCSKCGSSARDIKVNIYDYFPAGSAELKSVKQRVESLEQSGTLTDNSLILTKKEFDTAMTKSDKKAKLYLLFGLIVGIIGIAITIILA
jgi:predicted RNA-binding protein with PUA domain